VQGGPNFYEDLLIEERLKISWGRVDRSRAGSLRPLNRLTNNNLGTYLIGSTDNLPAGYLAPAGATYPAPEGCPALPEGESRLTTAGNHY
jgi:hypothetical protein